MHVSFRLGTLLIFLAPLAGAALAGESRDEVTTLPPVLVKESKAEAFFVRVADGEVTRLWFISLDRPGSLQVETRNLKTWGYMVAYRSHEVRPGDEIVAIADRPVAGMKKNEWRQALRSNSDEPPVVVTVRAAGTKDTRRVAVVPQNSVALGAKVLRKTEAP